MIEQQHLVAGASRGSRTEPLGKKSEQFVRGCVPLPLRPALWTTFFLWRAHPKPDATGSLLRTDNAGADNDVALEHAIGRPAAPSDRREQNEQLLRRHVA
jgi:hypothetical protein